MYIIDVRTLQIRCVLLVVVIGFLYLANKEENKCLTSVVLFFLLDT